jgi:hypothetical protein
MPALLAGFGLGVVASAALGYALAPDDKKIAGAVIGAAVGGVVVGPLVNAGLTELMLPPRGDR